MSRVVPALRELVEASAELFALGLFVTAIALIGKVIGL